MVCLAMPDATGKIQGIPRCCVVIKAAHFQYSEVVNYPVLRLTNHHFVVFIKVEALVAG